MFDTRTVVLNRPGFYEEVEMNQTHGATVTQEASPISGDPGSSLLMYRDESLRSIRLPDGDLNAAWTTIVRSVADRAGVAGDSDLTNGNNSPGFTITVDLAEDESAREFSTRLRMLILFMNRDRDSVSATVSPSFQDDTYPAMLALVNAFHRSGADDDWLPDGPRTIRVGNARHLFVSVDMPVADRSPSPDTLLEVVSAHRIDASWYDRLVRPRASAHGLTTVMFGVPDLTGSTMANSIFKQERARNLSGRSGGVHFSRQLDWMASAAV